MTDERPTPPPAVPDEVAETLTEYSASTLRAVAGYANALADHRAGTADGGDPDAAPPDEDPPAAASDADPADADPPDEDLPAGVPARATLTVKEINDNQYYYWQWREGDTVTSKYKGPVDPDE